jgi:hypothetical protein
MAKADTFNTPGNREDLTDIITTVYNTETPLQNLAKRGKAKAMLHEFQADKFFDPSFTPPDQGTDFQSFRNQSQLRARFGARVQRFVETVSVSTEEELVVQAGVPSESAEQKMKALEQLRLDVEGALGSDQASQVVGKKTYTRGLGNWLTNTQQTDQPVPTSYLTPAAQIYASGAIASVGELTFKGYMQSAWENGGKPNYVIAGTGAANQLDTFLTPASAPSSTNVQTDTRRYNMPADGRTVYEGIDFYKGPYGSLKILRTNYNARTSGVALATASRNRAYIINPDLLEIAVLQEMGFRELPDEGGGFRGYVDCFYSFGYLNPLGGAAIKATS